MGRLEGLRVNGGFSAKELDQSPATVGSRQCFNETNGPSHGHFEEPSRGTSW